MRLIPRRAAARIERLLRQFPVVLVVGPRQCGNTTLIVPIEIKLGAGVEPRALTGLRQCMQDLELKRGFVVNTGDERRAVGASIKILPWTRIVDGTLDLPL